MLRTFLKVAMMLCFASSASAADSNFSGIYELPSEIALPGGDIATHFIVFQGNENLSFYTLRKSYDDTHPVSATGYLRPTRKLIDLNKIDNFENDWKLDFDNSCTYCPSHYWRARHFGGKVFAEFYAGWYEVQVLSLESNGDLKVSTYLELSEAQFAHLDQQVPVETKVFPVQKRFDRISPSEPLRLQYTNDGKWTEGQKSQYSCDFGKNRYPHYGSIADDRSQSIPFNPDMKAQLDRLDTKKTYLCRASHLRPRWNNDGIYVEEPAYLFELLDCVEDNRPTQCQEDFNSK